MNRPVILDIFCGAGGAGVGYNRAGFDVVGVDIDPQPDYPFTFVQMDAMDFLAVANTDEVAAIHASPPCQGYCTLTSGTNAGRTAKPKMVEVVREILDGIGKPYVIENVQGSDVRRDLTLCGEMFGLGVIRHRYFELGGWSATPPAHVKHRGRVRGWRHGTYYDGPYLAVHGEGGGKGSVEEWQAAMGIDWTASRKSIAEAIPPAYTEWIGRQLMEVL